MKILFVCTGNTCRSPMAEIIFRRVCERRNLSFECASAGLNTVSGLPISKESKTVLEESGYSTEGFASTDISELKTEDYDLFAVMTSDHWDTLVQYGIPHEKIYALGLEHGGIADPYGMSEWTYRLCREEIKAEVEKLADWLSEKYGD